MAGVFLVHGTFGGSDSLGLLTELARFAPGLSAALGKASKQAVDWVAGESGNFTDDYARLMQQTLSAGASREIPVCNWVWSSQNNHIGRADGAVRLLNRLGQFAEQYSAPAAEVRPARLLLWGHSHGGNVFALAGALLAAEEADRDRFFHAARRFYRRWWTGSVDVPAWLQARDLLNDSQHPLRRFAIDAVTFGTPIRYGWAAGGIDRLLHFLNHRRLPDRAEYLAPSRIEATRLLSAADGDYVAQIGVSGSNLAPNPLALRTFLADWALDRLLEANLKRERLLRRIAYGRRVPDEGVTLLVDYDDPEKGVHRHLAGHAAYTRTRWLPFHCQQVADILYSSEHPSESP